MTEKVIEFDNKRVRLTIIDDWGDVARYVPDFISDSLEDQAVTYMDKRYEEGARIVYVDLVLVNLSTQDIEDRIRIVMSGPSVTEMLEILITHCESTGKTDFLNFLNVVIDQ